MPGQAEADVADTSEPGHWSYIAWLLLPVPALLMSHTSPRCSTAPCSVVPRYNQMRSKSEHYNFNWNASEITNGTSINFQVENLNISVRLLN